MDCDLLNPAAQNNLATGGDLCASLGGNNLNFGNANPNSTTVNPAILGGWGVRPYDWQFGASVQHELLPRLSIEAGYTRRWWGNFFVTDNVLTTAADYDTYGIAIPQHANLPGGGSTASFVAITPAAAARGAQNYMTTETDYGSARTSYWQGGDFTATARLSNGLTVQGGTSTGRAVRNNCDVTRALPELLGTARVDSCDVTEKWSTSFKGLASYTVPKIDVLVSASMRSLEAAPGGGVATNGLSLAANYVVPNTVIVQSLGRLPANALATGTTTVNLLNPGRALHAEPHQPGRHALRQDHSIRGPADGRRHRPVQPVQLERDDQLSADLRAADRWRRMADADGHRGTASRAVERDAEFLIGDGAGPETARPGNRYRSTGAVQRLQTLFCCIQWHLWTSFPRS